MATFVKILVAKYFFHSPWRPKWSQLGALQEYIFLLIIIISNTIKPFIVLPILNKMFEQMLAKLLGIMFNFCLGQALIAIIKYDMIANF